MSQKKTPTSFLTQPKDLQTVTKYYLFAKNCTNAHGTFKKGDRSRGAFSEQLIKEYLSMGILVEQKQGE
jgi:hypothetical protein